MLYRLQDGNPVHPVPEQRHEAAARRVFPRPRRPPLQSHQRPHPPQVSGNDRTHLK